MSQCVLANKNTGMKLSLLYETDRSKIAAQIRELRGTIPDTMWRRLYYQAFGVHYKPKKPVTNRKSRHYRDFYSQHDKDDKDGFFQDFTG